MSRYRYYTLLPLHFKCLESEALRSVWYSYPAFGKLKTETEINNFFLVKMSQIWIRVIWIRVADPDPHYGIWGSYGSALEWNVGSGSALSSKLRSFRGSKWSHGGHWAFTIEASNLRIESGGLYTVGRRFASYRWGAGYGIRIIVKNRVRTRIKV